MISFDVAIAIKHANDPLTKKKEFIRLTEIRKNLCRVQHHIIYYCFSYFNALFSIE